MHEVAPFERFTLGNRSIPLIRSGEVTGLHINDGVSELASFLVTVNLHALYTFVDRHLPATEVPEALVLKAKLDAALVADQFRHLGLVCCTLFQIGVASFKFDTVLIGSESGTLTDGHDHIVGREAEVSTIDIRSPGIVGCLCIGEEDLRETDARIDVLLLNFRT